ncbi:MAG: hypothetical protein MZV70_75165 [Desulfobacterales bacterium]|nr:hypothetical protein [Desulfobacterales bacterium]
MAVAVQKAQAPPPTGQQTRQCSCGIGVIGVLMVMVIPLPPLIIWTCCCRFSITLRHRDPADGHVRP